MGLLLLTIFLSILDAIPFCQGFFKFYGMGTFNLAWSIGGGKDAYGHVGDTYGYQSQTTYVPEDDFVITVSWYGKFDPPTRFPETIPDTNMGGFRK